MINAGIHDGDIIVVDRSISPTDGAVVVAVADSELTLKRLKFDRDIPELHAENICCGSVFACKLKFGTVHVTIQKLFFTKSARKPAQIGKSSLWITIGAGRWVSTKRLQLNFSCFLFWKW